MRRKPGGRGMKSGISAISANETVERLPVNAVLLQSIFESPCKQPVNREFIRYRRYFVNPPNL